MYDQILLITHGAALFPLGVFAWNWKMRKDVPSAFMFIKFLYGVTFFYYIILIALPPEVFTSDYDFDNWALLIYACSIYVTTVLYGCR